MSVLRFSILAAASTALLGCSVYTTPDGHSFSSADGTAEVQRELGSPDMLEERDSYYFGPYRATTYTYMDRRYAVRFINGLVRGVHVITEAEKPEYERRARAFKAEMPKVTRGDTAAKVLAAFGPPDYVVTGYYRGETLFTAYEGPYQAQLEESPLAEAIEGYWKKAYLFIVLRDGRVSNMRPMLRWDWESVLHEAPPAE